MDKALAGCKRDVRLVIGDVCGGSRFVELFGGRGAGGSAANRTSEGETSSCGAGDGSVDREHDDGWTKRIPKRCTWRLATYILELYSHTSC